MRRLLLILPVVLFSITASANSPPNPWRPLPYTSLPASPPLISPQPITTPPSTFQPITSEPLTLNPTFPTSATTPAGAATAMMEITVTGAPARLKLPRSLFRSLLASRPPQARSDAGGISPTRTVIAGLALSAAITVAGLTFARRKNARFGRVALLAITGTLVFAAVHVSANIRVLAPPLDNVRGTPVGSFPVTVEVSDGDVVELQLPTGLPLH